MGRPDSTTVDFEKYLHKEPTPLHLDLARWIVDKTGYDANTAKSKAQAFLDGVRLGASLRMAHQASPENQAAIAARKADVEKAAIAKAAAPPKPRKAAAANAEAETPAPARRPATATKTTKAAKAAAAAAEAPAEAKPAARRRPAKTTSAGAAEAPF